MSMPRGGAGLRAWARLLIAASLVAAAWGCQQLSYQPPPRGQPPPPLQVSAAKLVDATNGKPVQLKALNWFGFNNGQGAVDGLWAGGSEMATDFLQMVYQTKLLGFNAVRIPYRFADLPNAAPDRTRSCRTSPPWQLKRHVTEPRYYPSRKALPAPPFTILRPGGEKQCNSYLPTGTAMDRLLWTIQAFNAHGMYVILDYHGSSGQTLEKESIVTAQIFATKWAEVWRSVTCLPRFKEDLQGRVIADILNEPDMLGLRWGPLQTRGQQNPNWATLALAAMDSIYSVSPPAALFMVSGTGQTNYGLNWGNGYITDPAIIARHGLSDPNPFFAEVIRRPYLRRIILGPHCYPPSVTMATYLGAALAEKLQTSFGYLQTKGYCPPRQAFGHATGADGGSNEEDEEYDDDEPMGTNNLAKIGAGAVAAASVEEGNEEAGADAAAWDLGAFEGGGGGGAGGFSSSGGVFTGVTNEETLWREWRRRRRALLGSTEDAEVAAVAAEAAAATAAGVKAAAGAECVTFPVVIGEFGSLFEQEADVQWMRDFAGWLEGQGRAAGAPLGWAFWAYNANSGDTGGIVTPSWQGFMWVKLKFLQERMGLRPWYL